MFVLSFKNGNNDNTRNSFDKYYMRLVEIKDFIALIDSKPFSDQPVKNKKKRTRMKRMKKRKEKKKRIKRIV